MNWKIWLEGLASAALGGAVAGVGQLVSTTSQVNKGTGTASILGAIIGIAGYLKQPANQTAQIAAQVQQAPAQAPADPTPKP